MPNKINASEYLNRLLKEKKERDAKIEKLRKEGKEREIEELKRKQEEKKLRKKQEKSTFKLKINNPFADLTKPIEVKSKFVSLVTSNVKKALPGQVPPIIVSAKPMAEHIMLCNSLLPLAVTKIVELTGESEKLIRKSLLTEAEKRYNELVKKE
ncbi:MAG: hypothetical protein JW703_02930 [Candidatus Diapherotrites archaeon]|nr:hypothetical protein [Candidatus Diapherotrites archaeon]